MRQTDPRTRIASWLCPRNLLILGLVALAHLSFAQVVPTGVSLAQGSQETDSRWQHGAALFGRLKYASDFLHFEYANPNAPKGGTLVLAGVNFTSFTPLLFKGVYPFDALAGGKLYDSLFVRANDEPGSVYGNLAERIRIADDLSTVAIRIREGARWHDGVPMTAKDVKFTFDHVLNSSVPGSRISMPVESVEIIGEREILFRLQQVAGLNKNSFLGPMTYFPILPEHYWRTRNLSETTLEPPLGSGPYRIAEIQPGSFMLLERVPDYWARDLPVNKGRHNFDQLRFEVYLDTTVAREAFLKGLLDFRVEEDPHRWRTGYDVPAADKGWLVMRQHNERTRTGFQSALAFNTRQDKLADARVREALMLAFDFEWTNRVIYGGSYERAYSFFSGTMLAARGLPSEAELALLNPFRSELPARLFSSPFELPKTTGYGLHREALVRAKALFQKAGWTIRNGVMTNASGEPFTLEFLSDSADDKRTLLPYADQLSRLGIATRIRLVEAAQYVSRLRRFAYDALLVEVPFGFPGIGGIHRHFHSNAADTPGSANVTGTSSPAVDALLTELLGAGDDLDRLTVAARALDRTLLWNHYMIPILGWQKPNVVYWNKFGRPAIEAEYLTSFPDTWWWDEDLASRIQLGGT